MRNLITLCVYVRTASSLNPGNVQVAVSGNAGVLYQDVRLGLVDAAGSLVRSTASTYVVDMLLRLGVGGTVSHTDHAGMPASTGVLSQKNSERDAAKNRDLSEASQEDWQRKLRRAELGVFTRSSGIRSQREQQLGTKLQDLLHTSPLLTEEAITWAVNQREQTNTGTDSWPALRSANSWDSGLTNPQVYVISMENHRLRRETFAAKFEKLGLKVSPGSTHWAPGINGSRMPRELIDPKPFKMGYVGNFLAHFLTIDRHIKLCPNCDMVVFEDDVSFHPDFRKLWARFNASLRDQQAPGHLHIGGDAFWLTPDGEGEFHYRGGWVSRAWGYVLKASALRNIISSLQTHDHFLPVDGVLTGPSANQVISTFSPKLPLVQAFALASGTESEWNSFQDGVEAIGDQEMRQRMCWCPTYTSKKFPSKNCGPSRGPPQWCLFCPP